MIAFLGAAVCAALGVVLAWHYPIAPAAALAAFVVWSLIVFVRPVAWLAVIPALTPLLGFAPWTGWFTFEELDLLVLGAAAGGYARIAVDRARSPRAKGDDGSDRAAGLSVVPLVLVLLFAVSTMLALYRGFADAGGFAWGWFEGYYEPLNSLRIARGFALALILAPLLVAGMRSSGSRAAELLPVGFAVAGAGVAAAVVWERAAFPGVLNFSSDYRATGLFWEMHVGGATLDGILALTVPFAVRELLVAKASGRMAAAVVLVAALAYTCLTTFSRGVYAMLPAALAVLALLVVARNRTRSPIGFRGLAKYAVLSIIGLAIFHVAFRAGGYRTLAAVIGVLAVSLPIARVVRDATLAQWAYGIGGGVVIGAIGVLVAVAIPKGAYGIYAIAFATCVALAWRHERSPATPNASLALLAFVWLLIAAVAIGWYWGGEAALVDALIAACVLLALFVLAARAHKPLWPDGLKAQGTVIGLAALLAGIVAAFSGGAYMSERFATSEQDLDERINHWSDGLAMLRSPAEWVLGKGLGRFPGNYFFATHNSNFPGSYRLAGDDGAPYLILSGPTYPTSFGDLFRVSQRVPGTPGKYNLSLEARAQQDVRLHVEICKKHLLYTDDCVIDVVNVKPAAGEWHRFTIPLDGRKLTSGPWYAPRLAFFSIALETSGRVVDIRDVALIGPQGRPVIANGDFGNGMARWF
ncbi:MAG TPA: hypothetical protein VFJ48_00105, partial [Casimicrobiaceae bacterium]|nr:hypothetical protein [Casimicrobiaceae bacterium]